MVEPLLLFVNKTSGGRKGAELARRCQGIIGLSVVVLPDDLDTWEETHADILDNNHLRVIVAGGDGTINWTISLLTEHYGLSDDRYRPPLAAFPLGSGNDFCRTLGWGNKVKLRQLQALISKVVSSTEIISSDLWNVKIRRTDTGETITKMMINYFSLGCDAKIVNDFEACRQAVPGCFCCLCMNIFNYFLCGLKNVFFLRPISTYVNADIMEIQPETMNSHFTFESDSFKTLVFLNVKTIYGGTDLWYSHVRRSLDDHLFEVIGAGGSFTLGLDHSGIHMASPLCQGEGAVVRTAEPVYYQIDGEGYISNGPTEFTLTRIGSYPVIYSPRQQSSSQTSVLISE